MKARLGSLSSGTFLRRYSLVAVVLLLGVVLTAGVFNREQNEHQARVQAEF